jgi:hypothetical protein
MPSVRVVFRPVDRWPGEPNRTRKASPFKAGWADTIDLLDRELWHLGAREVVLQLALREQDIRRDGYPKSNARPSHPGAVVAFDSRHGPLKYATDTFDDWQANIRAIALGLEALRKVDRYGITKRGEQYTGWRALPGRSAEPVMTVEAAASFVWRASSIPLNTASDILDSPESYRRAHRSAAALLHPDAGGSVEAFQRLQEAKRALDLHHSRGEVERG